MEFALTRTVRTSCQKANSVSAVSLLLKEADISPLEWQNEQPNKPPIGFILALLQQEETAVPGRH
jgi:hypothetical protein